MARPCTSCPVATLGPLSRASSWTYPRGTAKEGLPFFHPGISHSPKVSNLDFKNVISQDMLIGLTEGNDHPLSTSARRGYHAHELQNKPCYYIVSRLITWPYVCVKFSLCYKPSFVKCKFLNTSAFGNPTWTFL